MTSGLHAAERRSQRADGWLDAATVGGADAMLSTGARPPTGRPARAARRDLRVDARPGAYAGWTFTAPPETTIANYTLWRSCTDRGSQATRIRTTTSTRTFRARHPRLSSSSGAARYLRLRGVGHRSAAVTSEPRTASTAPASQVQRHHTRALVCDVRAPASVRSAIDGARVLGSTARAIGLADSDSPRHSRRPPSGSLLTAPTRRSRASKTSRFAARDRRRRHRAGRHRRRRPHRAEPRARSGHAARAVDPFTTPSTLPASGDVEHLVVRHRQLPNGPHTVQASVTDAAGNETRSDPVSVTTLNGSQPNGRGASRFVKLSAWLRSKRDKPRRAAVVPYGSSRFAEGRLTDAGGHPIAGAVLQASSRVRRPGAKYRSTGTVTTGEDGRFAYRIAKGPSPHASGSPTRRTRSTPRRSQTRDAHPRRQSRPQAQARAPPRDQRPEGPLHAARSRAAPPARARA